jgi:hypothetical protein
VLGTRMGPRRHSCMAISVHSVLPSRWASSFKLFQRCTPVIKTGMHEPNPQALCNLDDYIFKKFRFWCFAPDNRPLVINTVRRLKNPGGPVIFLMDVSGTSVYEFDFNSLRLVQESPSVLALLVHANSRLQNVKRSNTQPSVQQPCSGSFAGRRQRGSGPNPVSDPTCTGPPIRILSQRWNPGRSSRESGIESNVIEGQPSMDLDDHSDLADYNEDDDTIDGLTFPDSEMRTVLQ